MVLRSIRSDKPSRFDELVGQHSHVLILPVCILEAEGGMREYMRAWEEEHRAHGRKATVLDPTDARIAWANRRSTLYFLGLSAQVLGFRCAARFVKTRFRQILGGIEPVDVVQVTTFSVCNDVLVLAILCAHDKALVINTVHDPVMHLEMGTWRRKPFHDRVLRNCWSMSAHNSRYVMHLHNSALLEGVKYPAQANIVYHEHPIPPRRAARRRHDSELWIGMLGRIEQYKGLNIFVKALRIIQREHPGITHSIRVIISGRGQFSAESLHGLDFKTTLENRFLTDAEFHQRMADLDVLVLPYVEATQSGVAAMGLAYGVRIVASSVGGIPHLLEGYQLASLVAPSDPPALAAGMLQAIKDTLAESRS